LLSCQYFNFVNFFSFCSCELPRKRSRQSSERWYDNNLKLYNLCWPRMTPKSIITTIKFNLSIYFTINNLSIYFTSLHSSHHWWGPVSPKCASGVTFQYNLNLSRSPFQGYQAWNKLETLNIWLLTSNYHGQEINKQSHLLLRTIEGYYKITLFKTILQVNTSKPTVQPVRNLCPNGLCT